MNTINENEKIYFKHFFLQIEVLCYENLELFFLFLL